ncbi:transient receptor potential cation channel subfamily M member 1, partial [Biomphalaria glabrata]
MYFEGRLQRFYEIFLCPISVVLFSIPESRGFFNSFRHHPDFYTARGIISLARMVAMGLGHNLSLGTNQP